RDDTGHDPPAQSEWQEPTVRHAYKHGGTGKRQKRRDGVRGSVPTEHGHLDSRFADSFRARSGTLAQLTVLSLGYAAASLVGPHRVALWGAFSWGVPGDGEASRFQIGRRGGGRFAGRGGRRLSAFWRVRAGFLRGRCLCSRGGRRRFASWFRPARRGRTSSGHRLEPRVL